MKDDLEGLKRKIITWAYDKGLKDAEYSKQFMKMIEEVGELSSAILKGRKADIEDGIGDVFVTLVILSLQLGYDVTDCVQIAYDEIKNRHGKMIDGTFVKEGDLA